MQKLQYMILKFIFDNQLENARTAKSILTSRPFYSCLLSGLAFVWQRGWS